MSASRPAHDVQFSMGRVNGTELLIAELSQINTLHFKASGQRSQQIGFSFKVQACTPRLAALWSTEVFQEHNGIWLRGDELSCAGSPMKVESVKHTDLALRPADESQLKREGYSIMT
ncbi:hypothetical protein NQZ68_036562 [Dissostichus eleginoides]|nr:hypothetical protein NQZ68_036562 [Dissostichus eleginoides]